MRVESGSNISGSAPASGGIRSSAPSLGRISSGISRPMGFEGSSITQASAFRARTFSPDISRPSQATSPSVPRPTLRTPDIFSSRPVFPNVRPGIEVKFGAKPKVEGFSNFKPKAFREKLTSPSKVISRVENFKWNRQESSKSKEGVVAVSFNEKVIVGSRLENVRKVVEMPTYRPNIAPVTLRRTYSENIFLTNVQRTERVQSKLNSLPKEVVAILPNLEKPQKPDMKLAVVSNPEAVPAIRKLTEVSSASVLKESVQVSKTVESLLKVGLAKTEVIDNLNKILTNKGLKVVAVPQTANDIGGGKRVFMIVATGQQEPEPTNVPIQKVKEFKLDTIALENRKKAGENVVAELFNDPDSKLVGVQGWQIAEKLNKEFTDDKKKFTSAVNVEDDPTPIDTVKILANKLRTVWSIKKADEEVKRTIFYNPPVDLGRGINVTNEEVARVLFGKAEEFKAAGLLRKGDRVLNIVVAKIENDLDVNKQ